MRNVILQDKPVTPSKVVCVGQNFVAHIEELGNRMPDEMVVFFKPNSAISDSLRTTADAAIHYEGELSFLVQRGAFAAVGFGLDLTRRELQTRLRSQGLPWARAKGFDGAAVFSRFVPLRSISRLALKLDVNGTTVQSGGVDLMIHKPDAILGELQRFITLEDGDIVMTGTPAGVGPVRSGDEFFGRVFDGDELIVSQRWIAMGN